MASVSNPTPLLVKLASPLPPPIAIPTPLQVHVQGGVPDWVAYCTLGIAIATLLAVGFQIWLAWRELNYVKQDLENQREQMNAFRRRPRLRLCGGGGGDMLSLRRAELATPEALARTSGRLWADSSAGGEHELFLSGQLNFFIANDGEKEAGDITVSLIVPPDELLELGKSDDYKIWDTVVDPEDKRVGTLVDLSPPDHLFDVVGGPDHLTRLRGKFRGPFHAVADDTFPAGVVQVDAKVGTRMLRWQIVSADGIFPGPERFGTLWFFVTEHDIF
jgi:hypothetical protein